MQPSLAHHKRARFLLSAALPSEVISNCRQQAIALVAVSISLRTRDWQKLSFPFQDQACSGILCHHATP
jgi:hypothetical protein